MKKLLGILLTFVMLFTVTSVAFATTLTASAASADTLNFNVTCDGANEVTKNTGDIITVTFTIENQADTTAGYNISSYANEIYYDHNFFEEVENSAKIATGVNGYSKFDVYSWGEHRAFFNGFQIPTVQYAAKQVIGTFQLKILATEGSSTINSVDGTMFAYDVDPYTLTKTGLVVNIGSTQTPQGYEITFNANGGTGTMTAVSGVSGAYTLPACTFTAPTGKQFKGWATSASGDIITSLDVTANTTLYAIWEDLDHTHNFTVLQYDEAQHWYKCDSCSEIDTKENHKDGTATCLAKAVCSVCEQPYGEKNANNHAKDTFIYQPNADGTTHTKKHECCGAVAVADETHTWGADDKCTACGVDKEHEHSFTDELASPEYKVTDATCQAKATYYKSCECGAVGTETFEYGEKDMSNHTMTTFTYTANEDGLTHTKKNECCGTVVISDEAHTYDAENKCICGAEKTVTPPVHTHSYSSEWSKNDTEHWHECECGEKADKAAHSYDENGKCVCGAESAVDQTDEDTSWFLWLFIIILIIGVIVVYLIQRKRRYW